MGEHTQPFPHKKLGNHLRKKRELAHESLSEVSGAVEIDEEMLSKIEQGILLPSEDILDLLIAHFSITEDDATKLYKLAGYEEREKIADSSDDKHDSKQVFMVVPFDNRVLYSDNVELTTNEHGIVLNFIQSGNAQPTTVSRIGMSKSHARTMITLLENAMTEQPQRMLPKPMGSSKKQK